MSRRAQLWVDDDGEECYVEFHFRTYEELDEQLSQFMMQQHVGHHRLYLRGTMTTFRRHTLALGTTPVKLHLKQERSGGLLFPCYCRVLA